MCGRYEFELKEDSKGKQLKERSEKLHLSFSQGEIFPDNDVLCVIASEEKIDLTVKKWGTHTKSFQINARLESLEEKQSYHSMKDRRCAVICNGFYEWNKEGQRYYIHNEEDYFYLACIFNEKDELLILTQEADPQLKKIHERKPVILNQEEMIRYVHHQNQRITEKTMIAETKDEQLSLF